MNKISQAWALFFSVLVFLLIGPILAAFFGGIGAWLVGLVFGDTILPIIHRVIPDVTMFEVGAFLAFVGSYFKATLTTTKD